MLSLFGGAEFPKGGGNFSLKFARSPFLEDPHRFNFGRKGNGFTSIFLVIALGNC
jgi:hypothetical protein